jgi:hypothetical protein
MNTNKSLADEEIKECVGSYNFTLIVEEDKEMFSILKNPFIIALKCTIKNGNSVLGVGRSNSVLSPKNKFLKNAVLYSWGASVIDALSKSVKTLSNLPKKDTDTVTEEPVLESRDSKPVYFTDENNHKYASDKQRNFLKKLVSKCKDSNRREYEHKLESPYLSSFECSALIKNLLTK